MREKFALIFSKLPLIIIECSIDKFRRRFRNNVTLTNIDECLFATFIFNACFNNKTILERYRKRQHYVDQEWKCLLTLEREVRRVGGREEGERERRRERKSDGGS